MGFRRKTRPGRLAQLDALLLRLAGDALHRRDGPWAAAPVVDLGIGAQPWTTLELAERVAPVPVVGVDIAEDVVARAQAHTRPGLSFLVGGLDLPLQARLVRVMNVLRDGPPEAVPDAHRRIGEAVLDGGLVLEGSCAPRGEAGAAHWLVKVGDVLERRGLVFWLDGSRGTAPLMLRDRLPRDLRGDGDHPVYALLAEWMEAHQRVPVGPDRFERSVTALARDDLEVVGRGAACWIPQGGVPPRTG